MDPPVEQQLEETDHFLDFLKSMVPLNCSFHRPIKLHRIWSDQQLTEHQEHGFRKMTCYRSRKNPDARRRQFPLLWLSHGVFTRFIELLAPLTHQHFCKASKQVYYQCLNVRGLEFGSTCFCFDADSSKAIHTCVNGFDGLLCGQVYDNRLNRFRICHNRLKVTLTDYLKDPDRLNFIKKYKVLDLPLEQELFDDHIFKLCDAVFHPKLEHLVLSFERMDNPPHNRNTLSLDTFAQFLGYCKHLKVMHVTFFRKKGADGQFENVVFNKDPSFSSIKSVIESWARTAPNLEIFIIRYKRHYFQLHEKQLKRMVRMGDKWFFTDKWDIDSNEYETYKGFDDLYGPKYPFFYRLMHYEDSMKAFMNQNAASNN